MTADHDQTRDLIITRTIKAPRRRVWEAWTDPAKFAQWWIPKPALCRVVEMDVRPGGAMVTEMSEDGGPFGPHLSGCYLEIVDGERLVFTNALLRGWRPAPQPFITAVITFEDAGAGTDYRAQVMHKDPADRQIHEDLGFHDGWGTVIRQLAELVE